MATKNVSSVSPSANKIGVATDLRSTNNLKGASETDKPALPLGAPADFNVNLSPEAKDKQLAHAKALDIARKTPEIREDKVAALKKQIEAGTYKPSSDKIADGMMREAIMEHLSLNEDR